ncbi:hypothetical protein DH2020_045434 [Rehmannia glutinosa]|uniref:Sec16 Sec23-binding domain-containing protein n=1 Tax=Rehmannia glutinosa TaxID=99300 RepID=A0ABR0UE70_REHGL
MFSVHLHSGVGLNGLTAVPAHVKRVLIQLRILFVGNLSRHRGPVRGLEFNSLSPNLLASGADEGDICIWDVTKPSEPSHFPPLKGSGYRVVDLRHNVRFHFCPGIARSSTYWPPHHITDNCFSDSIRRRCSVMQWNPDVATQLIVASDEDSSPSLRWVRLVGVGLGTYLSHLLYCVIAMSWCPIDSSYLLTCAKDNRTICWDTVSGEIVAELPAGTNWNFDVHCTSQKGGLALTFLFKFMEQGCGRYGLGESDFGAASLRAPKWYNQKAGVSFGFGGKLVSFHSTESRAGSSEVYVHNLVTEHGLASRSSEFEVAIKNGDRAALKLLCERKSQESESDEERETWGFLKVMFTEEGTARSKLLSHLGFSQPAEESNAVNDEVSEQVNVLGLDESVTNKEGISGNNDSSLFGTDNGEDFFNNLPSPKADTPSATSKSEFIIGDSVKESQQEMNGQEESSDPSFDDAVQHALVIAHVGGAALWERTRDQYLKTSRSPYLKVVVSAMVNNDLMSIANTRPLKSWKETLALFCTFAQAEEWTLLCDNLAARLVAAGDKAAATLCYICAGNIDKAVEMWSKNLTTDHDGKPYVDRLQDLMEKTIVFALATGQKRFSASLCKLVEKYAEILASQGLLTTAMEYLNLLGTEELSTELMILRDRIAFSTEPVKQLEHEGQILCPSQEWMFLKKDTAPSQTQPTVRAVPIVKIISSHLLIHLVGYNAPPTYQPVPQPNTQPARFVPSEPIPAPMAGYPPPPVNTQPAAKFVPANPPLLKNLEKYQQPSSLGSQLYPGAANPNYQAGPPGVGAYGATTSQVGPTPGPVMPQVFTPTPPSRGFMQVSNSEVQRPGMNPVQHPSPTQPAPVQPPVSPAAPPPTVQTVNT